MLPTFESQLYSHHSIPAKYFQRLQREDPDILATAVNRYWDRQGQDNTKRLVRTLDTNARAYLSDKFRPFDNAFALKASSPIFEEFKDKGLQVKSHSLTDDRMYMQLVFPSLSAEVVVGDVIHQGLTITNSEVGRGALEVASLLWRLVCSNGMIGESVLSRRHVGSRIDFENEDVNIYEHDTIQAELESYRLRMRDVIRHALSEAEFAKRIEALREANEIEFPKKKAKDVVQEVVKKFQFSEEELDGIFTNLAEGQNYSKYGLVNAVTALAHDQKNPDRAYDYEKTGHAILTLSNSEWKAVTTV